MWLGMKGTLQFAEDERPKSWREGILYDYPNGSAPITALTSLMQSEKITDTDFNWWTKQFSEEFADIQGIFTDASLTTAFTAAAKAVNEILYVKLNEVDAQKFRIGLTVNLIKKADQTKNAFGKVISVVYNGASSYVAVSLRRAISSGQGKGVDFIEIAGTANPQGANRPDAQSGTPIKLSNKTQIFRDPLSLTRTAMQTKLRTEDAQVQARREALEMHSRRIEMALLTGDMSETIGANNQPETTTRGIIETIRKYASDRIFNYFTDNSSTGDWANPIDWNGKSWIAGGEAWLDAVFEMVFRFGDTQKLALCGSGTLAAINNLVKSLGTMQLEVRQRAFGIQVFEWVTPHGIIDLKTHPLMSQNPVRRNDMLILEPANLKWNYLQDTEFFEDGAYERGESSGTGMDGKVAEFLTEAGLEVHFPNHFAYLSGFGLTNSHT